MTPGQEEVDVEERLKEEAPAGANTGSVPDASNVGPMKKKRSVITKHYIEIMGKRRKLVP